MSAAKSSISSLSSTPVPGTLKAAPNIMFSDSVAATALPSASITAKWVVCSPSRQRGAGGNALLGVARSGSMELASWSRYWSDSRCRSGDATKSGSPSCPRSR